MKNEELIYRESFWSDPIFFNCEYHNYRHILVHFNLSISPSLAIKQLHFAVKTFAHSPEQHT